MRDGADDGPVIKEGLLTKSIDDWDPLETGMPITKGHPHPVVFGVPKGAVIKGKPAPSAAEPQTYQFPASNAALRVAIVPREQADGDGSDFMVDRVEISTDNLIHPGVIFTPDFNLTGIDEITGCKKNLLE